MGYIFQQHMKSPPLVNLFPVFHPSRAPLPPSPPLRAKTDESALEFGETGVTGLPFVGIRKMDRRFFGSRSRHADRPNAWALRTYTVLSTDPTASAPHNACHLCMVIYIQKKGCVPPQGGSPQLENGDCDLFPDPDFRSVDMRSFCLSGFDHRGRKATHTYCVNVHCNAKRGREKSVGHVG